MNRNPLLIRMGEIKAKPLIDSSQCDHSIHASIFVDFKQFENAKAYLTRFEAVCHYTLRVVLRFSMEDKRNRTDPRTVQTVGAINLFFSLSGWNQQR